MLATALAMAALVALIRGVLTRLSGTGKKRSASEPAFGHHISARTRGSAGAGRVMRLTTAATTRPAGTPNTPAEIG